MGILRSDVVSHSQLEPTGSVFFDGTDDKITTTGPGNIGTSDFTIECWVYLSTTAGIQRIISANEGSQSTEYIQIRTHSSHGWQGYIGTDSGWWEAHSNNDHSTFTTGWHHVVLERYGNDGYIFVDGQDVTLDHDGSSASNAADPVTWTQVVLGHGYGSEYLNAGYISNARISLTTVYEGKEFTVPKFELEPIKGTYLLCCQSSSSSTEAAVSPAGLTVTGAAASAVAPDVKKDITDTGVVFGDNTKFDTLSYMVPPGGTTTESNRGRGVFGGYYAATSNQTLDYISIQSMGNAVSFGELVQRASSAGCFASSTRGIWCGGYSAPDGALTDTIQYVTIATQSNAIDFGNLTVGGRKLVAGLSNNTRGINAGGHDAPTDTATNIIDYVTIATTGNATNFGDLTANALYCAAAGNTTRGIVYLGAPANPTSSNVINYITIASAGNATDFGDATQAVQFKGGLAFSYSTRVVAAGGWDAPTNFNVIDYVTIATTGNATDFGDLSVISHGGASMTNSIRGVIAGTYHSPVSPDYSNAMEYITIATTGNGADFGDGTVSDTGYCSGCSDSHGGIS